MQLVESLSGFLLTHAISLGLGILASYIAASIWKRHLAQKEQRECVSLRDVWVEANRVLHDRPFAVCQFEFSKTDGSVRFKGDSYDNNGKPFYSWWSVVLRIDETANRLWYVYETKRDRHEDKDEGFGCIFLIRDPTGGNWLPHHGYFLDMKEAKPRHSTMVRFDDVAKRFSLALDKHLPADREKLISALIKNKDRPEVKKLFGWDV